MKRGKKQFTELVVVEQDCNFCTTTKYKRFLALLALRKYK